MTTPDSDLVEDMMGLVHRMADMVLRRQPEEREAEYAAIRDIGYRSAIGAGMSEAEARDAGVKAETLTRDLVRIIVAGGAAQGGNA